MLEERQCVMKKTCFAILVLASACLALCSCSEKEPEQGYKTVSDSSCDFSFEVPDDWDVTYTDSMLAANDASDGANVTAYAFDTQTEMGADDYFEQYLENFNKTFSTMNVTEKEETTLSGVIARHVFYTVDMGEDSFNCQTVICSRYGTIYMLTFTALGDTYESHTEEFERIKDSFQFK